jgi:YHS domain-containing protein
MIRLIIYAVIAYFAYSLVKKWMSQPRGSRRVDRSDVGRIDDVMVKDPQCGSYFPRRDGVALNFEGRELLFCSADCRDKFMADKKKPRG